MNPELVLLSSRIALLVLVASVLAFALGWLWRGSRVGVAVEPHGEPPPPEAISDRPSTLQQEELVSLSAALEASEKQCLTALEQRDEAERVAHERAREVRRLTDELQAVRERKLPRLSPAPLAETATEPSAATDDFTTFPPAPARDGLPKEPTPVAHDVDVQPAKQATQRLLDEARAWEQRIATLTVESRDVQTELATLMAEPPGDKAALKAATKRGKDVSRRLEQATEALARNQRQQQALSRTLDVIAQNPMIDDLTRIKGIKAVLNTQLNAHGVYSYRQIVQWSAEDALAFGEMLAFKNRITKDRWQEQARQLHQATHPDQPLG